MGELKIAITYDGPLDTGVDDRLRKAMESIGGKWYAQGTDRTTGVRDLAFDLGAAPTATTEGGDGSPCPQFSRELVPDGDNHHHTEVPWCNSGGVMRAGHAEDCRCLKCHREHKGAFVPTPTGESDEV